MSFVIHLFDEPKASTVAAATAACAASGPGRPATQRKFAAFLRSAEQYYPDAGAHAGVWAEALPAQVPTAPVMTLALVPSRADATVLATLGHSAADHDLLMLDPQNGMLYRPDRRVIHADGRVASFPPSAPKVPELRRAPLPGVTASLDFITLRMLEALAPLGFEHRLVPDRPHERRIERMHPLMQQSFVLRVRPDEDGLNGIAELELHLPGVRRLWQSALGERFERHRSGWTEAHEPDFVLPIWPDRGARDLVDRFAQSQGMRSPTEVKTFAETAAQLARSTVQTLVDRWSEWPPFGTYLLHGTRLGELVEASSSAGGGLLHIQTQMAYLVVAHLSMHPARAVWVEALRMRQRRDMRTRWKKFFDDETDECFEAVVRFLQANEGRLAVPEAR